MKKVLYVLAIAVSIAFALIGVSCDSDPDNDSIVGTWVDGSKVMKLDKNGNYRMDANDAYNQYRYGTYSYNKNENLLILNVKAVEGQNSAYRQTLIVQTLTETNLVLLYTDGDVEGFYQRR